MQITKTMITVRDLVNGYVNDTDTDIEQGVYAYGGKLCVRPAFQRSFVYDKEQQNAVIDTVIKGFPLNLMYWVDNGNGTYDCLDGQQRTISLCNFADGSSSFSSPSIDNGRAIHIQQLHRKNPELEQAFYDYELEVYICKGTKAEQLAWFKTINIAGEELYPQELRNVSYVSPWLTDAKRYFSKANGSSTAKCPAERIGGEYTNKNANRQEILAQVISWIMDTNIKDDESICQYMEDHVLDKDASELWNYFNNVINWVTEIFPGVYDKGMKTVNWGKLYNEYKNIDIDPDEIADEFQELMEAKATKELDISVAKICEYCISHDDTLLKHRAFNEAQKTTLYNRQKGICPDCGKHFLKSEMHAHHIVPWYNGGLTELDNGVMLCKECHTQRHL